MLEDAVVAEDLSFSYSPETPIIENLSLNIPTGSSVAIIGPSGSGKSTLLALLGGFVAPTSGLLSVIGVDISQGSLRRRTQLQQELGWVQQTTNLLPFRSARDNVALPLRLRGCGFNEANAIANQALEVVGLRELAGSACRRLSGGQAQRVCIARAVVTRPRLLLADEPTGQLDASTTKYILNALHDALKLVPGATLVIATHDEAATSICEHTLSVSDRQVVGNLVLS